MEIKTEMVYIRVWDSQYIAVIREKSTGKQILTIPFQGKEPPEEIETKVINSIALPPVIRINLEIEQIQSKGEK